MNKNLLVGLALLLLVGAGFYYVKNSSPSAPTGSTPTSTPSQNKSTQKSLKDLLLSGVSQKCTYKDKLENVEANGTTYMAGGKMRGDFNSMMQGKTTTMHMIIEGKTSYVWNEGQNTGFKMSFDLDKMSSNVNADTSTKQQAVDVNKMIDYSCSPWVVDAGMFTPPSGVKFTDYGTITIPTGMPGGKATPSQNCSACDSLSGDAKTQCRTALKCN